MILVDWNQIAIGSVMVSLNRGEELSAKLVRHIILNQLRFYRSKFNGDFGEMVICCDSRHYWRRDFFPNYKIGRKKARDESTHDWNAIFECIHAVIDELREFFPYKVIDVYGAEADDIIATLVYDATEKTLILSSDKDFIQLQGRLISQYSPIAKKMLKKQDPKDYLHEHIMRGDTGDGVPNILSADDTFITDKRQSPIRKNMIANVMEALDRFPPDKVHHLAKCTKDTWIRNWQRNETLIDLHKIPYELTTEIRKEFRNAKVGDRGQLLNHFIESGLSALIQDIGDF